MAAKLYIVAIGVLRIHEEQLQLAQQILITFQETQENVERTIQETVAASFPADDGWTNYGNTILDTPTIIDTDGHRLTWKLTPLEEEGEDV